MSKEAIEVISNQFPAMPPAWCSRTCSNALNEVCITHCAVKRDCSAFENKNIPLVELPPFPDTMPMTKEEKFTAVTVYLSAITDHLQGWEEPQVLVPLKKFPSTIMKGEEF